MTQDEMKAIRKGTGLSQQAIANELGISRKTVNEMENGAPIDRRSELAMQALARRIKLISDVFWVEDNAQDGWFVVRRRVQEHDRRSALYWGRSELKLYGAFDRQAHAERWRRALVGSDNPRNTRKLMRDRAADRRRREAEASREMSVDEPGPAVRAE